MTIMLSPQICGTGISALCLFSTMIALSMRRIFVCDERNVSIDGWQTAADRFEINMGIQTWYSRVQVNGCTNADEDTFEEIFEVWPGDVNVDPYELYESLADYKLAVQQHGCDFPLANTTAYLGAAEDGEDGTIRTLKDLYKAAFALLLIGLIANVAQLIAFLLLFKTRRSTSLLGEGEGGEDEMPELRARRRIICAHRTAVATGLIVFLCYMVGVSCVIVGSTDFFDQFPSVVHGVPGFETPVRVTPGASCVLLVVAWLGSILTVSLALASKPLGGAPDARGGAPEAGNLAASLQPTGAPSGKGDGSSTLLAQHSADEVQKISITPKTEVPPSSLPQDEEVTLGL
jgi:hypothetical protein